MKGKEFIVDNVIPQYIIKIPWVYAMESMPAFLGYKKNNKKNPTLKFSSHKSLKPQTLFQQQIQNLKMWYRTRSLSISMIN